MKRLNNKHLYNLITGAMESARLEADDLDNAISKEDRKLWYNSKLTQQLLAHLRLEYFDVLSQVAVGDFNTVDELAIQHSQQKAVLEQLENVVDFIEETKLDHDNKLEA